MAVKHKNKNGKEVIYLNPSEKGYKYCYELKFNKHLKNSMVRGEYEERKDREGNPIPLTNEERIKRIGYLQSQRDSAKCYRSMNKTALEIYRWRVKCCYTNMVRHLMSTGCDKAIATNFAYAYYSQDIEALEKGQIAKYSSVPEYVRY